MPITTAHTASIIFHRYFLKVSFLKKDLRDIAMGAVFLACKVEETSRKTRDIAMVFDQVFKISLGKERPVPPLSREGKQYWQYKEIIVDAERDILCELGFEIY